jgi:HEAT repeat protein
MWSLRKLILVMVSLLGVIGTTVMIWLGLGKHHTEPDVGKRLVDDPIYMAKRNMIEPLQRLRGSRPFTPQEMDLIRKFARDSNEFIRCRALAALSDVRDPQQRQEAIKIALERLKDPKWVVRNFALRVLAKQSAKECVSQILPLLNDPQPETREEAKKTLQQLGYKVGE